MKALQMNNYVLISQTSVLVTPFVSTLRLSKVTVNVSRSSKVLSSNAAAKVSAKLTLFVRFLVVLVWNGLSQFIPHVLTKSK